MAILGTLQIRALLDTANFGTKFNAFTRDLQKRAGNFQKSLSGLTNLGNLGISAGLSAGLGSLVSTAGEFELSLNKIQGAASASTSEMAQLKSVALEMGRSTTFSANQAAEGMLELVKAGLTPAQISAGALASTIKLAATESMELGQASTIVAEAMGAFKLSAADSGKIVNALAGASIASTAGVSDMAQGLAQVSAVASISGQNINTTAGALALMAQNGIKGSDAGTSLKTLLLRLNPATEAAAETMGILGIKFTDAKGNFKDLSTVAEILKTKLGKMSESQRLATLQTLFGTDAMRAASILTTAGAAGLNQYIDATKDQTAASKLADAQNKGWLASLQRLKNAFSNLSISLAEGGLLDSLTSLVMKGMEFVNRLSTMPEWVKRLAVGFGLAAAALPPFALALSSIITAGPAILSGIGSLAGFLSGPWGLTIAAAVGAFLLFKTEISAGVTAIQQWFANWQTSNAGALQALGAAWDRLKATMGPLVEAIKTALVNFGEAFLKAFGVDSSTAMTSFASLAGAALTAFVNGLTTAINWVTNLVQWLTTNLPAAGTQAGTAVAGMVQTIRDWFGRVAEFLAPARGAFESFGGYLKSVGDFWKSVFDFIATAVQVAWQKLAVETGVAKQAVELFGKVVEWLRGAIDTLATKAREAFSAIANAVKSMVDQAKGYLDKFTGAINGATAWMRKFTTAGEKMHDDATQHSWLKDMCLEGVSYFQHLITGGIRPVIGELGNLTKAGNAVKITPGAMAAAQGMKVDDWGQGWIKYGSHWEKVKRAKVVGDGAGEGGAKEIEQQYSLVFQHLGGAIDQFVDTGKLKFRDLWQSFALEYTKNVLKNAVFGLVKGFSGGGTAGGGGWTGILSAIGSAFGGASFAGGGYTGNGSRTGGLDGQGGRLAMLHPQETVIDHTKVRGVRRRQRGGLNLSVPITLQPGVSHEELSRILPEVQKNIINVIPSLIQRGGAYREAFA